MSMSSHSALDARFPQSVDVTRFSYTDNLAHLTVDAPVIPASIRHDVRQMVDFRSRAIFESVLETLRTRTADDPAPAADLPPEQARSAPRTRFYLVGARLDTHAIPDTVQDRNRVADNTPVLLNAETAFVCTTNSNEELHVDQVVDDIEQFDYFLLVVTHGATLPGVGAVDEISTDGLRAYLDKTLHTREQLLTAETTDDLYETYQTLIGACLQEAADLSMHRSQQPTNADTSSLPLD